MTDYKTIRGKKIKTFATDLGNDQAEGQIFYSSTDNQFKAAVSSAAWSSSGNLILARRGVTGAGTQTAGLASGGGTPNPATVATEEYNGNGWAVGGDLNTGATFAAAAGTQTAGLKFGGATPQNVEYAQTEHYDGSSWTESGDLSQARQALGGCGTQTAALAFGGSEYVPSTNHFDVTEEYNGSSWTSGGAMNSARRHMASSGTQTAALSAGGNEPTVTLTEEYNGTSWSESGDLSTARTGLSGAGIQTAALAFGGSTSGSSADRTTATEGYDGTSWSSRPSLGTARRLGGGAGLNTAAIYHGGYSTTDLSLTEEFSVSLTATTGAAFASGGNTVNSRRNAGCMGTQTAGLYAGGFGPPYLNYSEEYNGTSWTEGNNTTIARECSTSGFGTQTAGAIAGGGAPDNITSPYGGYSNSTDEYNGTSWSEGGDMNSHRLGMATCGTQTAGFGAGGYQGANHPESPPSNTAKCEQYDGTSWTEVADLNTARSSMGHFGTQTASIACRGNSNPTESWDGSSWTNLPASPIVFNGGNHGGGTQTAGVTYGPRSGNYTEAWDGTTWATSVRYSTSRGGNNAGDASDGLLCGGFTGSGNSNATEEFTGETTAARAVKTIDFD